ncbi:MAG: Mut7-C RNAse domain-containing protein [Candidatus Odinarchaeota archaeon]
MKFWCDQMLGGLARWLRILGYDTHYEKSGSSAILYGKSLAESRLFITRSGFFHNKAKAVVVRSEKIEELLAELKEIIALDLTLDLSRTRCATCNGELREITVDDLSEAFKQDHSGTISRYSDFSQCIACRKIYWVGVHFKQIEETLTKAREII